MILNKVHTVLSVKPASNDKLPKATKKAIEDYYLTTGKPLDEIAILFAVSESTVSRIVTKLLCK